MSAPERSGAFFPPGGANPVLAQSEAVAVRLKEMNVMGLSVELRASIS